MILESLNKTPVNQALDIGRIRGDFPALQQLVHGKPLVYLDNAATTQMPTHVDRMMSQFNLGYRANVHRGVHELSQRATRAYEETRRRVQAFINAAETAEIVYVRGTTEGINLVAQTYGRQNLHAGDEILITEMEHHSNIVPWQMLCNEKQAHLKIVPMNDAGELDMQAYAQLLSPRTKLVAVSHVSNALGTINPVDEIIRLAHAQNIPVLIDGAQAVSHLKVDVQKLDCDFYVFSGHKIYGPTGIGILYGKRALLEGMPPYQGGGDMIRSVTFANTTYNDVPFKFEAGTHNIAGVIGLGAAIDYVEEIGLGAIAEYEHQLLQIASEKLVAIPKLKLIGTAQQKTSVVSFVIEGIHPHDIGTVLDREGIAIRAGHHCAQPVMQHYNIAATARASLACYNTVHEIDRLVAGIHKVLEVFA
jgi:cysteine desulfurase/selenocysteine lyase